MVATLRRLLLLRTGVLGKGDQKKSSSPLQLKERCNCEAKEDI